MQIIDATVADIPEVQRLAGVIWRAHYLGIISAEQIEYMLERGYATAALADFINKPDAGLLLAVADVGERIGFAAWYLTDDQHEAKLDKLYVLPSYHGQGIGHALIEQVAVQARTTGAITLIVRVNKSNSKAIAAYKRTGFSKREALVEEIGQGFVMDDYVLARPL
jgi:ribosomal protein S18 acetylase RimI-like enzyme